jgi:hypothetical protein
MNNTKKHIILVIMIAIIAGCSYALGTQIKTQQALSASERLAAEYSANLSQKNLEIEELRLCLENIGRQLDSFTEPYNYETFGILSEKFADKEVVVIKYRYCESDIVEKYIVLEDTVVRVYYIENLGPHSKNFNSELLTATQGEYLRDIPTFNGYENFALNARFVSDIVNEHWSKKESYITQNNIESFYVENYDSRSLVSLNLQFYSSTSPLGAAIFVSVSQNIDSSLFANNSTDAAIYQAKHKLNEFVDTVRIEY